MRSIVPERPHVGIVKALLVLLAAWPLAGCWEWNIFVPEDPNACGTHVPPVTGPLTVVSFTLIDVVAKSAVVGFDPIPANAIFDLATLPGRLNIRANCSPDYIGGVEFNLDGSTVRFEYAPPYMLGGDTNCGQYRNWEIPAPGVHTLTGTALRNPTPDSERGGMTTLSFTID